MKDKSDALTKEQTRDLFKLEALKAERDVSVEAASAITGEGLETGLRWLVKRCLRRPVSSAPPQQHSRPASTLAKPAPAADADASAAAAESAGTGALVFDVSGGEKLPLVPLVPPDSAHANATHEHPPQLEVSASVGVVEGAGFGEADAPDGGELDIGSRRPLLENIEREDFHSQSAVHVEQPSPQHTEESRLDR